jgi:hypothetical protein
MENRGGEKSGRRGGNINKIAGKDSIVKKVTYV